MHSDHLSMSEVAKTRDVQRGIQRELVSSFWAKNIQNWVLEYFDLSRCPSKKRKTIQRPNPADNAVNIFPVTYFGKGNDIGWVSAKNMELSIITSEKDKIATEKTTFDNQHAQYEKEDRFFRCKRNGKNVEFEVKETIPENAL